MKDKYKIAELQALCSRAYAIVSEHWDEMTDEEGYGPSSLLKDLKKAMEGQEVHDVLHMNELLSASLSKTLKKNKIMQDALETSSDLLAFLANHADLHLSYNRVINEIKKSIAALNYSQRK